jgi:hypothetical protein
MFPNNRFNYPLTPSGHWVLAILSGFPASYKIQIIVTRTARKFSQGLHDTGMNISAGSFRQIFAIASFDGNRLDMSEQLVKVVANRMLEYVV